jgi:hypothetical protein
VVQRSWLLIVWAVALGTVVRTDAGQAMTSAPILDVTLSTGEGQSAPAQSTPGDNAVDDGRLAAVLPRGVSSQEACRGLKSLDLCAATLHAAQNLSIPFAELKRQVAAGQGLDAAIHTVKPSADASAEATRAREQARQDMRAPGG